MMTLDYYNATADAFRERTKDFDLTLQYDAFLARLPVGAHILDAGCGPGRDAAVFLKRGYRVTAIDASHAMVELATKATGLPVRLLAFQQIDFDGDFDGVWMMASLLHVPTAEVDDVVRRLTRALKPGGVWYMSVKVGDGERRNSDGRMFYDYTPESLRELLSRHPALALLEIYESEATTPPNWLHATVRKIAHEEGRPPR
jgi:SAM-dependent methyltransferase